MDRSFNRKETDELGLSLVEALVALNVVCLALLLVLPMVRTFRAVEQVALKRASAFTKSGLVFQILEQNVRRARPISALAPIWLHEDGAIRLADGALHPITRVPSRLRPAAGSDAITFLIPDVATVGFVAERDLTSPYAVAMLVCLPEGGIADFAEGRSMPEHWLALTLDGAVQVEGRPRVRSRGCPRGVSAEGEFRISREPMFRWLRGRGESPPPSHSEVLGEARLVVGIRDLFSVYLDESGTLRRLSHISTENQPLLYGFRRFEISSSILGSVVRARVRAEIAPWKGGGGEWFEFDLNWPGRLWRDLAEFLL